MQIINKLLEWNFRPSHLKYTAEHLFTQSTKKQIDDSKETLEKIIDKLPDGSEMPSRKSIEDVYYLFLNNYQTLFFSMSKRNIRHLIWTLDFQPTSNGEKILLSNKLDAALNLIKENWKDSFIISLWHVLLKNWTDLQSNSKNLILLFRLLKDKCKRYNRNRSDILKITQNIEFFLDKNSPKKYALLLLDKKLTLSAANKLFDHKERIISYDYFACVAHEYISQIGNKTLDYSLVKGVYQFLKKHNSNKTSLLICGQIINNEIFQYNIDIVKSETVKVIGDPSEYRKWINSDLKKNEQEDVEKARKQLNIMLNKEFIEVFFERLVQDERREKYWLKFIDKINEIKFVGNRANYLDLKKIESISNLVDNRYKITSSNQSTCALVMYSKGYVFVEFSDVGALYIYKEESFISKVNLNAVSSMRDLKKWSNYDYACRNSSTPGYVLIEPEGKATHQGDWESRVDVWMNNYYYD